MYFPYLKGKLNEIAAIEELETILKRKQNVIPIFEIVSSIEKNSKKIKRLLSKEIPFIMIANPIDGKYKNDYTELLDVISDFKDYSNNFTIGINITSDLSSRELDSLLDHSNGHDIAFIHHEEFKDLDDIMEFNKTKQIVYNILEEGNVSKSYKNRIKELNNAVLLNDGFNKERRNADYPKNTFFSDDMFEYEDEDYIGISDFSIVGKEYISGGGPAHAVAIHLSELYNSSIRVNHFVSDDTNYAGNIDYKFFQALKKLIDYIKREDIVETEGIKDFIHYHETNHFPNLGPAKRSSIKHHIEMISSNI